MQHPSFRNNAISKGYFTYNAIWSELFYPTHSSTFDNKKNEHLVETIKRTKSLDGGYCNLVGKPTGFTITTDNLREDIYAEVSQSVNRQRQIVCALSRVFFNHAYAAFPTLATMINENNLQVLAMSPSGALYSALNTYIHPNLLTCCNLEVSVMLDSKLQAQNPHQLSFDDKQFDLVIGDDVMAQVSNVPLAESEVLRILKPGGVYCFSVPFAPLAEQDIIKMLPSDGQKVLPYRIFSYYGLCKRLSKAPTIYLVYRFWSATLGILGKDCFIHVVQKNTSQDTSLLYGNLAIQPFCPSLTLET